MKDRTKITVASQIRRIFASPERKLICRQHLLALGSPRAVDGALFRMVKSGRINRIAVGMYARERYDVNDFSAEEVAETRASLFGKQLKKDAQILVAEIMNRQPDSARVIFAVDGSSSRFKFKNDYIVFHSISGKKKIVQDDRYGQSIRAYWSMGNQTSTIDMIEQTFSSFNKADLGPYFELAQRMPLWLLEAVRSAAPHIWNWHVHAQRRLSTPICAN